MRPVIQQGYFRPMKPVIKMLRRVKKKMPEEKTCGGLNYSFCSMATFLNTEQPVPLFPPKRKTIKDGIHFRKKVGNLCDYFSEIQRVSTPYRSSVVSRSFLSTMSPYTFSAFFLVSATDGLSLNSKSKVNSLTSNRWMALFSCAGSSVREKPPNGDSF